MVILMESIFLFQASKMLQYPAGYGNRPNRALDPFYIIELGMDTANEPAN